MSLEMIQHSSAANMVRAWEMEMPKIGQALAQIGESIAAMNEAFQANDYREFRIGVTTGYGRSSALDPSVAKEMEYLRTELHQTAWRRIVDKIELRKLLSTKRAKELDDQLDGKGEPLPPLTLENLLGVVNGFADSVPEYLGEICLEVYEFLVGRRASEYKTNKLGDIGQKRIIEYGVTSGWSRGAFRVNHHRTQQLNSLSNVFALLDGKGPASEYMGELVASINGSTGSNGETTYFKWKAFKNGNLHVEFKRPDLVKLLIQQAANRGQINGKPSPASAGGYGLSKAS